jgi:hypothetical protein
MPTELLEAVLSWRTFLIALLVFGFAPGALLRLIVLAFPRNDPRRQELLAELPTVARTERPFWVFEQLERALFEGIGERVARVATRDISRRWYPESLIHRGIFLEDPESVLHYFVKVINRSHRDIVITHVWFDADPAVPITLPDRPLPTRLRPHETWEGWVEAAALVHVSDVERSGRVRLISGKLVKSRSNENLPPKGYVAGGGTPTG